MVKLAVVGSAINWATPSAVLCWLLADKKGKKWERTYEPSVQRVLALQGYISGNSLRTDEPGLCGVLGIQGDIGPLIYWKSRALVFQAGTAKNVSLS